MGLSSKKNVSDRGVDQRIVSFLQIVDEKVRF